MDLGSCLKHSISGDSMQQSSYCLHLLTMLQGTKSFITRWLRRSVLNAAFASHMASLPAFRRCSACNRDRTRSGE